MEELINGAMPILHTMLLGMLSLLVGFACNYIREKTKIDISEQQEKYLYELAKRYIFHTEEKSERLKLLGHSWSSKVKAKETISRLSRKTGISENEAEIYVDAALVSTGLAAAGKKRQP